jgi:hypothetical protein
MTRIETATRRLGERGHRGWLVQLGCLGILLMCATAHAAEAAEPEISSTPSATKPYFACPHGPCDLVIDPHPVKLAGGYALPEGGPLLEGSGEQGGYSPQDLQSAYRIPTGGGAGQTVAVIDPYKERPAEESLAVYRERYRLGPCTRSNGCFRKVNERGEEHEPEGGENLFALEETDTDIEMVSTACPGCRILLVEATSVSLGDLAQAVDTAARLGATEISNSYSFSERSEEEGDTDCGPGHCQEFNSDYDHPGIPITASAGDGGYEVEFPASASTVIAVGGTNLRRAANARGWSEEAWRGTGSGCSELEPKPAWQKDSGCSKRTNNDVAAVAGVKTPVSVYIEAFEHVGGGWGLVSGTSVAAPLIAGLEAHASEYTRSLGAQAFYDDPGSLFDVTSGSNGKCSHEYLCTAGVGYDGPTGLGTPDGVPCVSLPLGEGPPCELLENEPGSLSGSG